MHCPNPNAPSADPFDTEPDRPGGVYRAPANGHTLVGPNGRISLAAHDRANGVAPGKSPGQPAPDTTEISESASK